MRRLSRARVSPSPYIRAHTGVSVILHITPNVHTHIHIVRRVSRVYIYIYTCVCVCENRLDVPTHSKRRNDTLRRRTCRPSLSGAVHAYYIRKYVRGPATPAGAPLANRLPLPFHCDRVITYYRRGSYHCYYIYGREDGLGRWDHHQPWEATGERRPRTGLSPPGSQFIKTHLDDTFARHICLSPAVHAYIYTYYYIVAVVVCTYVRT